jgi:hypothetical protein
MVAPESPSAMPAQVTGPGTEIVKLAIVPVPAENSGKLPFVKTNVDAVNAELDVQFELVLSQVPLVAAEIPLLSHQTLVALELPAARQNKAEQRGKVRFLILGCLSIFNANMLYDKFSLVAKIRAVSSPLSRALSFFGTKLR